MLSFDRWQYNLSFPAMELDIVDMSGGDTAMGDAGAVADAVARLVKDGFAVRDKGGGTRRCGYGDICVLLRSRARFGLYAVSYTHLDVYKRQLFFMVD